MTRVLLAMSGGVDSSVAAHLLQQSGHEVIGVFMRHGASAPSECGAGQGDLGQRRSLPVVSTLASKQGCCTAADAEDARRVADRLDIPFYALDLQRDFDRIIEYFVEEYTRGRTPNPCIACNHWIKFGRLFDFADAVDATYVATGHYARCERLGDTDVLRRGLDRAKDQSYVLFGISEARLQRMLLPVGAYRKSEIRDMAAELGLSVAHKKDSQEICFVPDGDYARFVRSRSDAWSGPGEIITTDGRVVGRHEGIEQFTVGQRKGLGVALGEPHYVVRTEPQTGRVVIGCREELACRRLSAAEANWFGAVPATPFRCHVQFRYNAEAVPAEVVPVGACRFDVHFEEPCYGVAPGQAAVCYHQDRVLGGGWIMSAPNVGSRGV